MQRLWVLLQMSFTRFMQMAWICMKERSPSFNFAPTSRDTWHPEMQNGVAFNAASHLLAVRAGHVSLNEACGLSPGPYSVCLPFPLPACRRQTHNRSDRIRWHSQTLQACAAAGLSHSKHRGVHCASSSVDRQGAIGCRAVTSAPRFPACAAAATCLMSSNLWHQLLYIHRAAERQTTAYKKWIKALLKMNGSTNVFSTLLNLVQVQCCTQFSPVETQEKILKLLKFQVDTVRGLILLV